MSARSGPRTKPAPRRSARRGTGAEFPCARCGRALRRRGGTRGGPTERPAHITCVRCGFMMYDYPRVCAGMIVLRGDQVLALRRGHHPRRGYLDFPGGFMEAGEHMEAAARRELHEETGLELGRVSPLGIYWDRYFLRGFGWFPTLNFYFVGRWRSGVPVAADDAASAEWIALSRLGLKGQRLAWKHMPHVLRDVRRRLGRRR